MDVNLELKKLIELILRHRVILAFHWNLDPKIRYTCNISWHYNLSKWLSDESMEGLVDKVLNYLIALFANESENWNNCPPKT